MSAKSLIKQIASLSGYIKLISTKLPSYERKKTEDDLAYILKGYTAIKDVGRLSRIRVLCSCKLTTLKTSHPKAAYEASMDQAKKNVSEETHSAETFEDVMRRVAQQGELARSFPGTEQEIAKTAQEFDSENVRVQKTAREAAMARTKAEMKTAAAEKEVRKRESSYDDDEEEAKEIEKEANAVIYMDPLNMPKVYPRFEEVKEDDNVESKTFVMRDGKVVEGKGERREEAEYVNWCCSNADPEELRKHRELLDRQKFKGPKWEGIRVKHAWEEDLHKVPYEGPKGPSIDESNLDDGKKTFEKVVR